MDTRVIAIVFGFLVAGLGNAQVPEGSIPWSASKRLEWSDFKAQLPPDASSAATTASGISYTYSANIMHHEVELDFEVTAYFYPNESWYKPTLASENLLQHEQLHFDISELFARKMRLKLRQTTFTENVKTEIRKIYRETLKELSDFQDKYDWETNFSRNEEMQKQWNTRIREALIQMPQ